MNNPFCCTPFCGNYKESSTDFCSSCNRSQRKEAQLLTKEPKERKPIRKVGLPQAEINRKLSETYKRMDAMHKPGFGMTHDHTISQKRCKHLKKPWLIWHEGNIEYSDITNHNEWESYKDGKFANHKNFEKRMAFLKEHDIEGWEKRMMALERLEEIKNQII